MLVNEGTNNFITDIDGEKYRNMLYGALTALKEQQSLIDSLNVFPVPDGDTGTNMYLTFLEAIKEVKKVESNRVDDINSALTKGALMGARGNSGVILSQLLRGFYLANKNNKVLTAEGLVKSFRQASDVAYHGVLKPVEGTILTVSRKAAEGAETAYDNDLDIISILEYTINKAHEALNRTPEQLPALKEAEVVDAGGQGYVTILEGMLEGITNKKRFRKNELESVSGVQPERKEISKEIKYVYCTQLLIYIENKDRAGIEEIREDLQSYGDSIMAVGSDNVIKIHIHTNHPGIIIEYGLKIGSLNNIDINNMKKQNKEMMKEKEKKQKQEYKIKTKGKGIIAVGQGEGIKKILIELGVDKVIDGGQSMNPSTNDFVEAINSLECSEIIILPNNKNIISAAKQAATLSDKAVNVLETRSIPEAVAALMNYNPDLKITKIKENMETEIKKVKTLEITEAVKDSRVNGLKIKKGDIIGLCQGEIKFIGKSYEGVVMKLLQKVFTDEELVTIFYGKDIDESTASALKEKIENEIEIDEVEIYYGGQPLYPYLISLE